MQTQDDWTPRAENEDRRNFYAMKTRADIANSAVRIFLQEFGAAYDDARGMPRYVKSKHFEEIKDFFGNRCCYCDAEFDSSTSAVQDRGCPVARRT